MGEIPAEICKEALTIIPDLKAEYQNGTIAVDPWMLGGAAHHRLFIL
jgi:hypothetical protein